LVLTDYQQLFLEISIGIKYREYYLFFGTFGDLVNDLLLDLSTIIFTFSAVDQLFVLNNDGIVIGDFGDHEQRVLIILDLLISPDLNIILVL